MVKVEDKVVEPVLLAMVGKVSLVNRVQMQEELCVNVILPALLPHVDEPVFDGVHVEIGADGRLAACDPPCEVVARRHRLNPHRGKRIMGQHKRIHA